MDAMFPASFPSGEGSDLAGIISEVGANVSDFVVGDEVLGWSWKRSSHAEYVAVPAKQLIKKPAQLSWKIAGSLYIIATTGYAAVEAVNLKDGDTVVISGAAGGVGSIAVQLAKQKGANVIGIASESNHAWLTSLGIKPVAYGDDLVERLKTVAPDGIDAIIDLYGPEYIQLAADLGIASDRINTIISFEAAKEIGAKAEGSMQGSTIEILSEIAELVASGKIQVPIAATYPLEQVKEAYNELVKHHTHGKIVLIP
jgi:NADPH2:quinone reductase